jgi:hypothetical protein
MELTDLKIPIGKPLGATAGFYLGPKDTLPHNI